MVFRGVLVTAEEPRIWGSVGIPLVLGPGRGERLCPHLEGVQGTGGQGSGGEGRCILQLVTSARSKCRLIYRVRLGLERGSLAGSAMSHRHRGQSGGRDCTPPRSFSQLRRSRGMRPLPALPSGDREAAEGARFKHTLPAPPQARRLGPGVQRTAPSPLASLLPLPLIWSPPS